jgi:hypothetical protein
MSDAETDAENDVPEQTSGAKQYKKVKHTPLTEEDGWTVLSAAAIASAAIALAALGAEVVTDAWLAKSVGFGVYLTTPLGLGATFLTVIVAKDRSPRKAAIPAALVVAYWMVYVVSVLWR